VFKKRKNTQGYMELNFPESGTEKEAANPEAQE
jgi:hypothetical protein